MNKPIVAEYGRSALFETSWGLHQPVGQKLAAIITYSGSLEYFVERAIWRLENRNPEGERPDTDGKAITKLISQLEETSCSVCSPHQIEAIALWCQAANSAFVIRNNIAHGVATKLGDTLAYMRNPRWNGEIRKRGFGDFWADEQTLYLVSESFAVLLRVIVKLASNESKDHEISSEDTMKALREARSILGEFR